MVKTGVTVYALAPDYDEQSKESVKGLGALPIDIKLERAGMHPFRDFRDTWHLILTLRRLKPDAAFSYFIKPVIYGSIAAYLAGVPRIYALVAGLGYVFSSESAASTVKRRILRRAVTFLYRLAFSVCKNVFFQNNDDLQYLVNTGCLKQGKAVRVNGTGVDLESLSVAPFSKGPTTYLLMARLLREKGICEFADAARTVKAHYHDTRFILLGGLDPNPNGLKSEEVEDWVAEGLLEWPGQVSDVKSYIAQSSVYVLPSYYREGVPRSTQEAMAMGRAVITTDSVGCRDTVVEGVNGFLVPVRDPVALSEAMIRFIEAPELIAQMGKESRRLAEERFDVHKINKVIMNHMGL